MSAVWRVMMNLAAMSLLTVIITGWRLVPLVMMVILVRIILGQSISTVFQIAIFQGPRWPGP